ncbi:hypothetical protein FRC07_013321, partial [Ceratobasidium sp. 392]
VGSAGDTFIFSRPAYADLKSWDFIDHIPAPSEKQDGLVHALGFFGVGMRDRQLFIGYAKEGFSIWHGPGDFQRTPLESENGVCTIASAAFSTDGKFIAILTLEHHVVLYPLTRVGPTIGEQQVLPGDKQSGPRPVVPIALSADNLVLRGSVTGTVPIVDLRMGPLAPIQNRPKQVIRALATSGDKIIVGFSDLAGRSSQVICYQDLKLSASPRVTLQPDADQPMFEITIGELEEQAGLFRTLDGLGYRKIDQLCKSFASRFLSKLTARLQSRRTWYLIVFVWMFTTILVTDPPTFAGHATNAYWTQAPPKEATTGLTTFDGDKKPGSVPQPHYPTLAYLLAHCGIFIGGRFMWWGAWFVECFFVLLGYGFKALIWTASIIPLTIEFTTTKVPEFLTAAICDVLRLSVCPPPKEHRSKP